MAEQTVNGIVKVLRGAKENIASCHTATERLLSPGECEGISGILPPRFSRELVGHFCANEWAVHLDDVMVRRSGWHYYFIDAADKAKQAAGWMGEFLGWPESVRDLELERYQAVTCGRPPRVKAS
jgi:glycerol-3-phosphate dehydrogenase